MSFGPTSLQLAPCFAFFFFFSTQVCWLTNGMMELPWQRDARRLLPQVAKYQGKYFANFCKQLKAGREA